MTTNWGGNYIYRANVVHRPSSLDELSEIVVRAERVRVIGTQHSFSDIADAPELIVLDGLPGEITVDGATVTVPAALTYSQLADRLREDGLALRNLASLPHISVGGAIATATHGSGNRNGNLATQVAALELMTSRGELTTFSRGGADFDGAVVGLGSLGAVTRVTLDVEPAYDMQQRVFEHLSWDMLFEQFDAITATADSVSVFTLWSDDVDQIWLKSRVEIDGELLGAAAATAERHPIPGADPVNATAQLGQPGLWSDRLPHFRSGFMPSAGDEIQSEYLVDRRHGPAAIEALLRLGDRIRPLLYISEIRTIAADDLWLSPEYGRDSVAIHFTWKREQQPVERALAEVERALEPFAPRPHWGKLFLADAAQIAPLYERLPDFVALLDGLDPRGAFRNAWLERHLLR
ncbi:MAG TPA: D-arabinono-1,4-lactone oxidase [Gaiellaceae bacterium]|nr:D-arabinono-1,4-lactone oxidase [Gaiellaceae bacterium]